MTGQATKTFQGLPQWAQGVIAVGILGGVGYLIYKLNQASKNKNQREEDRNWNKAFDTLNSNPKTKSNYSKEQLLSFANSIEQAMQGYGTDEAAISRVIRQMKNDADFAGLSAAFGVRTISTGALNPEPNFKGTLSGALTNELSNAWVTSLNKALEKQGIKYRF